MYGFQPKHARGKPAQALAGGGLVHSITGMLGMRKRTPEEMLAADAKVQERNLEAAARVAARAKPTQQAAPAEEKAVSSYAGMSALQRREKELGLKDGGSVGGFKPGGLIRGPGTGTSDSIKTEKRPGTFIMPADSTQAIGPEALERLGEPEEMGEEAEGVEGRSSAGDDDAVPVALSNGEFEFTPEQVQALGEAVLTVLRDATHTPVEGGKPTAKGFAPNQFFANGGNVKRLHLADAGVVTRKRLEEEGRVPNAATSPSNIFPGNRLPDESGSTSAPPPVAPSTSAPTATAPSTRVDVSAGTLPQEQGDPFLSTPKARAGLTQGQQPTAAPSATTAPATAPATAQAAATQSEYGRQMSAVGGALVDGAAWLGKTIVSAPGYGFSKPSAAPAPAVATATAGAGRGSINPASVNPAQPAAAATEQTNAATDTAAAPTQPPTNEVMPGVYRHGRGQYSDNAAGMAMPPGFTGQPSAQNMAAADALAQRSQAEAMNRVARGFAPAGTASAAAPASGGENFDWMKDLRDPRTLALRNAGVGTTIFRNKGEEITANKARQARVAGVQQAINDRMRDAQQAETTRYQSDNTLAGNIATEQMRQDGANTRDAGRNALTAEELGLKREAAGFQTRAAQQLEQLRNTLIDPKATPQQRAVAQRNLAALSGKTAADRMQTVTLPDTTNEMGQVVRGGQALVRVLEDGTVQQVPIGAQQGAALPPGMKRQIGTSNGRPVYEDMNGKQVIAKG